MLSIESETRLAECFLRAADGERQVEFRREVLAATETVGLRALFDRVDRRNNGFVAGADVQDQVCLAGGVCSEMEATLVMRQYDGDADGRWGFQEFCNFLLPATNPELRARAMSCDFPHLSAECEDAFCELLSAELQCQRELESARSSFAQRYDFNLLDAFRTVDVSDSSYIDPQSLISFMQRRGAGMTKEMADAVVRRVDMDGDGRISYVEFVDFLIPMKRVNPGSDRKYLAASMQRARTATPLRAVAASRSEARPRYSTPLKSPNHVSRRLTYTPEREVSAGDFAACVKSDIELYRELQRAKSDLVTMPDFSPVEAFRVFDCREKSEISPADFSAVMHSFGIVPLDEDVKALFLQVGSGRRLTYLNFVSLLSPEGVRVTERKGLPQALSHETTKRLAKVCEKLLAVARAPEAGKRAFEAVEYPEKLLEEATDRLRLRLTPSEHLWLLARYSPSASTPLSTSQLL